VSSLQQEIVQYVAVERCPLCGGAAHSKARLQRHSYHFGQFCIALPEGGIELRECGRCALLFKALVPSRADINRVLSAGATDVWRPKTGLHPALAWIGPHLPATAADILDVGASNGDLLRQLAHRAGRLSALDVTSYAQCAQIVTGEYIIGELDDEFAWSQQGYDIVTAFDVFEHFWVAQTAVANVVGLVRSGGRIIVETGDWTQVAGDLGRWYYCNLFEHQIFWCRRSFEWMCAEFGLSMLECRVVNHKGRRAMRAPRKFASWVMTLLARNELASRAVLAATGRDPGLLGGPSQEDHIFVVMRRS